MNRTKTKPDREAEASGAPSKPDSLHSGKSGETRGPIASLHRSVGNQGVQALLERDELATNHRGERPNEVHVRNSPEFRSVGRRDGGAAEVTRNRERMRLQEEGFIQPNLELSNPDDPHEREARRVADQVMNMPDPTSIVEEATLGEEESISAAPHGTIQSNPYSMLDVEEFSRLHPMIESGGGSVDMSSIDESVMPTPDPDIQRSATVSAGGLGGEIERNIQQKKGGGRSLSDSKRSFFEPRFGLDFSDVRIHSDKEADQLSRSLGAKAFTSGKDIFFQSSLAPSNSKEGMQLLAHELAHVSQGRNQSKISRAVMETIGVAASIASLASGLIQEAAKGDVTVRWTKIGDLYQTYTNISEVYNQEWSKQDINNRFPDEFHAGKTRIKVAHLNPYSGGGTIGGYVVGGSYLLHYVGLYGNEKMEGEGDAEPDYPQLFQITGVEALDRGLTDVAAWGGTINTTFKPTYPGDREITEAQVTMNLSHSNPLTLGLSDWQSSISQITLTVEMDTDGKPKWVITNDHPDISVWSWDEG